MKEIPRRLVLESLLLAVGTAALGSSSSSVEAEEFEPDIFMVHLMVPGTRKFIAKETEDLQILSRAYVKNLPVWVIDERSTIDEKPCEVPSAPEIAKRIISLTPFAKGKLVVEDELSRIILLKAGIRILPPRWDQVLKIVLLDAFMEKIIPNVPTLGQINLAVGENLWTPFDFKLARALAEHHQMYLGSPKIDLWQHYRGLTTGNCNLIV